jgi:HPt (histidine-containing phosphotransfer) domain-containing protein
MLHSFLIIRAKMNSNQEHINPDSYSDLKSLLGDNLSDFLQSYISSMDNYTNEGKKALLSGNMHNLVHNVHPMKSTSAMIGAIKISELAYEIEVLGRKQLENSSINIQEISEKYDLLVSEYEKVTKILEKDI